MHLGNVQICLENDASAEERHAVFAKATPAIKPPPAEQAEADAASGGNGANAEQAPTPPSTEVEAGPAESAEPRAAAIAAAGRRR